MRSLCGDRQMNATPAWVFDATGPDIGSLNGPIPLSRKGMGLPPRPGLYLITAGDCLAHAGASGSLRTRVGTLARLGTHRGSGEVLCAAYCTGIAPTVWWEEASTEQDAKVRENAFKSHYGEPPSPRARYSSCVNGSALMAEFVSAAGADSWEAGYAEAVFTIGERFSLLFADRFLPIWRRSGLPPGPWASAVTAIADLGP